MKNIHASYA
ncbi:hypothetical protein ECPA24_3582, partial [Escherichia coli PA24]